MSDTVNVRFLLVEDDYRAAPSPVAVANPFEMSDLVVLAPVQGFDHNTLARALELR